MKKLRNIITICLALIICLSIVPSAFAADSSTAIIDTDRKANFDLFKYDMTSASEDGVFSPDSYVSDGKKNAAAESALENYAIKGVIFTYIKVADITTYSAQESGGYKNLVLYNINADDKGTQFLNALGLSEANAYTKSSDVWRFTSDTLIDALEHKLENNSSILKNELEKFVSENGGKTMPETDAKGHSSVSELDLGLYLLVETSVPEKVFSTTAPFLISLPMTTIDGKDWNYDVTVYPKNETDMPNLDKTLRESKKDTGKNEGKVDDISDGYADTATGSDGDVVDYQIISTIPEITSNATALSKYTFVDELSKGIEYNKNDVKIEWYKDAECKELLNTWNEGSGKFNVAYGTTDNDATTMTITMTESGLDEINNSTLVYNYDSGEDTLFRGYSKCTIRITYACTVNSSADVIYGDNGNPNEVTLTWGRTNHAYDDSLKDHCHFYTYGMDLTKNFSDDSGNYENVKFIIHNDTDGYWVKAQLNAREGIYYVTAHETLEDSATIFTPTESNGKIIVKGLEDDAFTITEIQTDKGYTLLKDAIKVVITQTETEEICPESEYDGTVHHLLTATATVNGDTVSMTEDNDSLHAVVPFTVVNTKAPSIPITGVNGLLLYGVSGLLVVVGFTCLICGIKKRKKNETA